MSARSFEQILREHLNEEEQLSTISRGHTELFKGSDACLDFLCTATEIKKSVTRKVKEVFSSSPFFKEEVMASVAELKAEDVVVSPKVQEFVQQDLDVHALSAFELFKRQGEELKFPLREEAVISAWRRLARKTHPDTADELGVSQTLNFQVTREAYLVLKNLFRAAA